MDEDREAQEIESWEASGGRLGRPPAWYFLLMNARYLGVKPWELEQHPEWLERARTAQIGEIRARNARVRKQQRDAS